MQGILKHLFNCISYCSPAGRSLPEHHLAAWAKNRIQADLAPFAQLSKEQLRLAMDDPAYLENPDLIAYRIFKGKLSIQATRGTRLNERVVAVTRALHRTCMRNAMPDMDFLVTLHDAFTYVAGPNPLKAPLFSFAKHRHSDQGIILIPDFEALRGYKTLSRTEPCSWSQKKPLAVWRGTTTGGQYRMDNYLLFPRARLVALSKEHPEYLDARFNAHCLTPDLGDHMQSQGYMGASLSTSDQLHYKYQILIDGNSCAYSRAYWQLFSNSLILKVESDNIQWYYDALVPYEHYVPVKSDLSNLIEQIEWARSHDREARQIVQNANAFAENNLQKAQIDDYLTEALLVYARLNIKTDGI